MEFKAGQWYCTRSGEIAYVYASLDAELHKRARTDYPIKGVVSSFGQECWTLKGYVYADNHAGEANNPRDLVEHLPDCTGFDWKPVRWRPATPDDVVFPYKKARFDHVCHTEPLIASLTGTCFRSDGQRLFIANHSAHYIRCEVFE